MENELYHYGVLGMKWGVRRYQNKDGSLTPRGKKRYNSSDDLSSMSTEELRKKVNRMNLEKQYTDMTRPSGKISKANSAIEKSTKSARDAVSIYKNTKDIGKKDPRGTVPSNAINIVESSSRLAKKVSDKSIDTTHAKKTKVKLDKMSDNELRDAVDRLNLERQYSSLSKETVSRGKVRASDVLDVAGDVLAISASAVTLAVGIKKLMNK